MPLLLAALVLVAAYVAAVIISGDRVDATALFVTLVVAIVLWALLRSLGAV